MCAETTAGCQRLARLIVLSAHCGFCQGLRLHCPAPTAVLPSGHPGPEAAEQNDCRLQPQRRVLAALSSAAEVDSWLDWHLDRELWSPGPDPQARQTAAA